MHCSARMAQSASIGTTSVTGWGSASSGTRGATQRKHMVPHSCPTVWIQLPRYGAPPGPLGSACATISVKAAPSCASGVASASLVCTVKWR